MDELCIIEADYANWRPVSGRKVLQLVLEVPIEKTQEVLAKLGIPTPGESIWVAVAILDKNKKDSTQASEAGGSKDTVGAGRLPRPWKDMPYSQQAAIRCGEPAFQAFLNAPNEEVAAGVVRLRCGVKSRSDLDKLTDDKRETTSRIQWAHLEGEYQRFLTDRKFKGARR